MTAGLPLMKTVLTPLAKRVLLPFQLSARMLAADAAIPKKIYGSGRPLDLASRTTELIISKEEIEDVMKIVKSIKNIRITNKKNQCEKCSNTEFFLV